MRAKTEDGTRTLMKGDETVEPVKLLADKPLFIYRRHANSTLQQFIEEEIEPDTTFL